MKLRQIINENSKISTYFDCSGIVEKREGGIVCLGNMIVNTPGKQITELPWKIDSCRDFIMKFSRLRNLKNFPRKAFMIDVAVNDALKSLASEDPITVKTIFDGSSLKIENLDGVKISADILNLRNCRSLKHATGYEGAGINNLYLTYCENFEQDPKSITWAKKIFIYPTKCKKMPLIKSILFADSNLPKIEFEGSSNDMIDIIQTYKNKGLREIVNLMRELRDAGYKGNARI